MKSDDLFARAVKCIPGGVNSPVRAFKSVGGTPVFIDRASGSRLWSVDGTEYIDYCSSWGPCILGNAHPDVLKAAEMAAHKGLTFGACTEGEVELAEFICDCIPSIDLIRLVTSGTEAVMTALRLARAFTGRDKIIKFDGCYHGHCDSMLVAAGSGLLTGGISSSKGVQQSIASDVFIAPYNDIRSVKNILDQHGSSIAAIIVEPAAGNMGLVLPDNNFLESLRDLADRHKCLLICDEVITGFRFGPSAYSTLYNIEPDIITLGKIIGGGLPVAAIGGKAAIMEQLAPLGPVYQAGTLSGNPVAVAAGLTTLQLLRRLDPYSRIEKLCSDLASQINSFCKTNNYPVFTNQKGSLFTIYFGLKSEPHNLDDVRQCDTSLFTKFFRKILEKGIYFPPSQFETAFVSAAHTEADIDRTVSVFCRAITELFTE